MADSTATKKHPPQQSSAWGRSVVDYVTETELNEALSTVTPQGLATNDWVLPVPDPDADPQTQEGELARLLSLKSYMLLDSEPEQVFDDLTREARDIFGVPTSLISLIDLGRQFLFSNTGAAPVRETTRAVAFCSHTILNKDNLLVVNDTKEDDRFKESELVNDGPKLRFYAGAPLISPEGHKLGTFCIEGPEARPQGLSEMERSKLKEYAAKTVELMVARRKRLRDRLSASGDTVSIEIRKHAGVATSLGDLLYMAGKYPTAMRLYQESVQCLMSVQNEGGDTSTAASEGAPAPIPAERQQAMAQYLALLTAAEQAPNFDPSSSSIYQDLLTKVMALYTAPTEEEANHGVMVIEGLPGLFQDITKQLQSPVSSRPLPALFFNEVFQIDIGDSMAKDLPTSSGRSLDEVPFTVPLAECSKATLFNMGQIQYHWNNSSMALQFFHLAASVSQQISPLEFDPIDLGCVNNMAQIHLQYGQPDDAMKMLTEALERGNRTLAAMYRQSEPEPVPEVAPEEDGEDKKQQGGGEDDTGKAKQAEEKLEPDTEESLEQSKAADTFASQEGARRTRRLRRKLARTLINIGHVHYFNHKYVDAMKSCCEAASLLDSKMEGRTQAAIWYNMALIYQAQRQWGPSLQFLDRFLEAVPKLLGPDRNLLGPHNLQTAEALHRRAELLFEMKRYAEARNEIDRALQIRKEKLGKAHNVDMSTSLDLAGKIALAQNDSVQAVTMLKESVEIQRQNVSRDQKMTFDGAQILLDLGRAYHANKELEKAVETYLEVLSWAKVFFGKDHVFVARISTIVGNLYVEHGKADESKVFLEEASRIKAIMPS